MNMNRIQTHTVLIACAFLPCEDKGKKSVGTGKGKIEFSPTFFLLLKCIFISKSKCIQVWWFFEFEASNLHDNLHSLIEPFAVVNYVVTEK